VVEVVDLQIIASSKSGGAGGVGGNGSTRMHLVDRQATAGGSNTGGGGGGGAVWLVLLVAPAKAELVDLVLVVVRTPSATSGFISATPGTNTVTSAPCGVHK
jgi:GTPase involved in cell partitioning and DNA repair